MLIRNFSLLVAMLLVTAAAVAQTPAAAPAADDLVALRLKNNSTLVGRIVSETPEKVVLDAGPLGQLTIAPSEIAAKLPAAAAAPPPPPPPPPGLAVQGIVTFGPTPKPMWIRTVDLGGTYNSAIFKQGNLEPAIPALTGEALRLPGSQFAIQVQAGLVRATDRHLTFLNASQMYAKYEPFGVQADNPKFSVGHAFRRSPTRRWFLMGRYDWYQDNVKKVDYSHQVFGGLGTEALKRPKVSLNLVPIVGMLREKKGTEFDGEWLAGFGGLTLLQWVPTPHLKFEQRETYYQAFNESSYRGLESTFALTASVAPKVNLTVTFTHVYDNVIAQAVTVLPPGSLFPGSPEIRVRANEKTQAKLLTGLQVRF